MPLGAGRVHRAGRDVTVLAVGHLVHDALAVADDLAGEVSVEVFDPRTLYPFDWEGLAASLDKTGRLVVLDDSNRFCGLAAEIIATAAEEMRLLAPAASGHPAGQRDPRLLCGGRPGAAAEPGAACRGDQANVQERPLTAVRAPRPEDRRRR